MAKQINFKKSAVIKFKVSLSEVDFFSRVFSSMQGKDTFKAWPGHIIVNFYSPCRQTVSQRKEMCQKLKAEI